MIKLTNEEQASFINLCAAAQSIKTVANFKNWANTYVRAFFPFGMMAAVLGSIIDDSIDVPPIFRLPSGEFYAAIFADFVHVSSNQDTALVNDSRVLNVDGFDYKRLRCIQSWQPSCQHG